MSSDPTGGSANRWGRYVRSERRRAWLVATLALALVLSWLCVWTVYSAGHTYPRYRQLAAGAASTGPEHYRVLKLVSTTVALSDDGDPVAAPPNTVWVIADVQITIDQPEKSPGCSLQLLGPGGRVWEQPIDIPSRKAPIYCDDNAVVPGVPYSFEQLYQIPQHYAHELRGLVLVNDLTAAPSEVIRPA